MNSTNKQKNKILNSHAVAGAYGKTNALAKLTSAIQVFNKNKGEIYDINKHEARSLYARAGSNFPPGSAVQDGLSHRIFDAGLPVNKSFMEPRKMIEQAGKSALTQKQLEYRIRKTFDYMDAYGAAKCRRLDLFVNDGHAVRIVSGGGAISKVF